MSCLEERLWPIELPELCRQLWDFNFHELLPLLGWTFCGISVLELPLLLLVPIPPHFYKQPQNNSMFHEIRLWCLVVSLLCPVLLCYLGEEMFVPVFPGIVSHKNTSVYSVYRLLYFLHCRKILLRFKCFPLCGKSAFLGQN